MSGHHTRLRWCRKKYCLTTRLDPVTSEWLFDGGSLTARLIEKCEGAFSVEVLSIERATPSPDEIEALDMQPRRQAIIRQVLLYCGDTPVVYARTVIPLSSLRGALRGLALLGTRPLGAVLFSDNSMKRKPMEVTSLMPHDKCYAWTRHSGKQRIWGRRSVFEIRDKQLLVSEFFLPGLAGHTENS